MPWNITASIHSSHRGSSTVGGYPGLSAPNSVLRSGQDPRISTIGSRRGRLTSASPLAGRGMMRDALLGMSLDDDDLEMDMFGGMDVESTLGNINREHNVAMSSPTEVRAKGAEPEWFLKNLDQQSVNFLEFVRTRIEDMSPVSLKSQKRGEIAFSSLLPPESSDRMVATQGILLVLTLATNGVLRVRQDMKAASPQSCDDAGEILLSMNN